MCKGLCVQHLLLNEFFSFLFAGLSHPLMSCRPATWGKDTNNCTLAYVTAFPAGRSLWAGLHVMYELHGQENVWAERDSGVWDTRGRGRAGPQVMWPAWYVIRLMLKSKRKHEKWTRFIGCVFFWWRGYMFYWFLVVLKERFFQVWYNITGS